MGWMLPVKGTHRREENEVIFGCWVFVVAVVA
jgi:hypothetical protein